MCYLWTLRPLTEGTLRLGEMKAFDQSRAPSQGKSGVFYSLVSKATPYHFPLLLSWHYPAEPIAGILRLSTNRQHSPGDNLEHDSQFLL